MESLLHFKTYTFTINNGLLNIYNPRKGEKLTNASTRQLLP